MAELTAKEREEQARVAVQDERTRIARELHDVVAHSVSVMVLHAGAARRVLRDDPEPVAEPLLLVEETGREALAEMQRLLGILRENGAPAALSPQPGLDDVPALADQVRRSGPHTGSCRRRPTTRATSSWRLVDDGRGSETGGGTGHGLVGLRERAALYGGEVEAAPLAGRGFRVWARLPFDRVPT